ncbi:MAG: MoaD/ThiS family protein [Thermoplasmata archaeon]
MAEVRLDGMLAEFVPRARLRSSARSVDSLLDDLEARYPRLRHRIRDETHRVRPFVKIFVNGEELGRGDVAERRLGGDDSVDILHSIQGG